MQKAYVVVDHVFEADMVVAVFSRKSPARQWVKAHKGDPYSPEVNGRKYEDLAIEEHVLDPK